MKPSVTKKRPICKDLKAIVKADPDYHYGAELLDYASKYGGSTRLDEASLTHVALGIEDRDGSWDSINISIDKLEEDPAHRADRLVAAESARQARIKADRIADLKSRVRNLDFDIAAIEGKKKEVEIIKSQLKVLESP